MTDTIITKIKKLLALGKNNNNEHEAAQAMAMAAAMMAKHGIEQDQLKDADKPTAGLGPWITMEAKYWRTVARAAAHLYGGQSGLPTKGATDRVRFAGRPEVREAAEETFAFIILQIEALYKAALPKGLSKTERAEFRATFKQACAARVEDRVGEIVHTLQTQDVAATGSTALVVANHRAIMAKEIEQLWSGKGKAARSPRVGNGSFAGWAAGDHVDLNQKVK